MSWTSFYEYWFPSEEIIPIPTGERLTYVTRRSIKLIKPVDIKYFEICTNETWLAEKIIPRQSYFRIVKYVKDLNGRIRIIAQIDQVLELVDMSTAFVSIHPLIIDNEYISPAY